MCSLAVVATCDTTSASASKESTRQLDPHTGRTTFLASRRGTETALFSSKEADMQSSISHLPSNEVEECKPSPLLLSLLDPKSIKGAKTPMILFSVRSRMKVSSFNVKIQKSLVMLLFNSKTLS